MERLIWIVNRVAVAMVGVILVGGGAAVITALYGAATCGPTCTNVMFDTHGSHCLTYSSTCGTFWPSVLVSFYWTGMGAIILGTLPGIAALTLTPAKRRPWKSLPILIAATLVGFGIWLVVANLLSMTYGPSEVIVLFAIPTATGLAAAMNVDRLPPGGALFRFRRV